MVHSLAKRLSDYTNCPFEAASKGDLAKLRKLNLPKQVIDFYRESAPIRSAHGQVRLCSIADIVVESRDGVPGLYSTPMGYVVFATSEYGDAYCFNLNNCDSDDDPEIVLISHEMVDDQTTPEQMARLAKPVAQNLTDFLEKFLEDQIDEECVYDSYP
jgi:SMI1/KNR4 family protein SUKH-1